MLMCNHDQLLMIGLSFFVLIILALHASDPCVYDRCGATHVLLFIP